MLGLLTRNWVEWFSSCGLLPPTAMRPTQQQRLLIHFLSSPEKTHLSLHTYLYFQPQKRFHQKTTHSIFLNYRFKSVHKSFTEPCTKTITRNSRLHLRPQRLLIPPVNQRWPLTVHQLSAHYAQHQPYHPRTGLHGIIIGVEELTGGLLVEPSVDSGMKSQGLHSSGTTPSLLWWPLTPSWPAMLIWPKCIKAIIA